MIKLGRRRARRVVKKAKKVIPRLFRCPNCDRVTLSVTVDKDKNMAKIFCSSCRIYFEMDLSDFPLYEPVDIYGYFVDLFSEGEIEVETLTKSEAK